MPGVGDQSPPDSQAKFRWPPVAATPPGTPTQPHPDLTAEAPRRTSPPNHAAPATDASLDLDPFTLSINALLRPRPSRWREFERAWLGPTLEPFASRAADLGWRPDDPDTFCPRCASTVGPYEIAAPRLSNPADLTGPAADDDLIDDDHVIDDVDPTDGDALTTDPRSCLHCRERRLPWDRAFRLGSYDGLLRDAIHELKFTRFRPDGSTLGRLLGARLAASLDEARIDRSRLALVPIPMSRRRRLTRGIDHTLVLARAVRAVTGGRLVRALARRHRPSQLDVPPSDRRANVSGSFRYRERTADAGRFAGWTVIVIDDVRTTGSTLREACRTLRRGVARGNSPQTGAVEPVRIWAAVVGVTPRPEERRKRSVQAGAGTP